MSTKFRFAALLTLLCVPAVQAREATLTDFNDLRLNDHSWDGSTFPIADALRHHLETLGQGIGGIDPQDSQELVELSAGPRLRSSCSGTGYSPTWWLKPEVEIRRAAHFETMALTACEFGIPMNLLDAVISQESGYKGWAVSPAGAMGMMQIMPGTAKSLGLANPWDSAANMRAGARYLRQQLDRFGRVDLALAAYNAGPERRSLAQGYVPAIPETINYVRTITTNWARLAALSSPNSDVVVRAAAARIAVRASGYREVSLTVYDGMNSANPI
ncbi:MAG: lytic transglycosylase domain-containing protein [Sphingomonadaceae bacterium]|nr:lytic transglycosylase domain-containing protein [Altererythrobacter sp.]MCP5392895.1 lytic transglycosylase domain-containing protein [Sphingomonadaceae bacterium]